MSTTKICLLLLLFAGVLKGRTFEKFRQQSSAECTAAAELPPA